MIEELFEQYLPFWKEINGETRDRLLAGCMQVSFPAGAVLHSGEEKCSGPFLIRKGRLRAFVVTPEGKEITLFRLLERDFCIFSASCIMKNISFHINIAAETQVEAIRIPAKLFETLSRQEISIANFTNDIMGSRMSDVMWILEDILYKSFDRRLAAFLLEESTLEASDSLNITHEQIAGHLGSAREVVSRMLRYFSREGLVESSRGCVELLDKARLEELAGL